MSSTTGIQNLLVNVFRPVYFYDAAATNTLFIAKLEMSNIDTYWGNAISVSTAAVGDLNNNVYVGSNAGNPSTLLKACVNNTAVGYGAGDGISNVSNSVYLGYSAGSGAANASNVIAIGAGANGNGVSNISIGNGTGTVGSNNILIGHGIAPGNVSNTLQIGGTIYGDLSTDWIGIGTPTSNVNSKLDVSGNMYVYGQVGINMVPNRTFDVNGDFRATDSSANLLDFTNGITTSSGGLGSLRGTITVSGGASTIGVLKKGVVLISAVDSASSANRASRMLLAYTPSNVTDVGSNVTAGNTSITTSTSNIQITDATNATYTYSITYFPLP